MYFSTNTLLTLMPELFFYNTKDSFYNHYIILFIYNSIRRSL
jgi:hypothetical protein